MIIDSKDRLSLLAEKRFLLERLNALPESAVITRMSVNALIQQALRKRVAALEAA